MPTDTDYPPFDHPATIADIWVAAWNSRDPDRLAALFDEEAEFVNVTGLWWHDREAIRKAHDYGLREIFGQSQLTLVDRRVRWLVGDQTTDPAIAVVHAKMRLEGQTPVDDIEAPGPRRNIFSFVVHRTDGEWSCASAHNTDVIPGSETLVADPAGGLRAVDYRTASDQDPEQSQ
jgi:uncharacterized protein (TIGR02246 family)